jgi:cytochrome P450
MRTEDEDLSASQTTPVADGARSPEGTPVGFVPRSRETWRTAPEMYRWLRDNDPVHHVESGDYWVLSRFDDVFAAARDTSTFSSADGLTFTYGERKKAGLDSAAAPIVMMDPPEHTAFRRLVARGFTPRAVSELEPAIRAFVRERLAQLVADGTGDVVATLFKPLPSFVVAHYLGVPAEDRQRFDVWTDAIVAANAEGRTFETVEGVADLLAYFADLIERRRAEPGDDTISQLVAAEEEGATVSIVQVLGFAFTMVAGGNDTTTGLLGGGADLLTQHRDQRAALLADPALIPNAVEELLRLTAPVQGLARTATRDVTIGERVIPRGRKVLLLYASANRDPRHFGPNAEACDVERQIDKMLSFSYGAHHCLGAAAARLQARIALEELLATCPDFEVDSAAGRYAPGNFVRRFETLPFSYR